MPPSRRKAKVQTFGTTDVRTALQTTPPAKLDRAALFEQLGSSGLKRFGGTIYEEFLVELRGDRGRKLYREMRENHPVINAVFFVIEMALRQVKWEFKPATDLPGDKQTADFLNTAMDDMEFTWSDTLAQIITMLQYGFSVHELVYKLRHGKFGLRQSRHSDGLVGWRSWLPIAQDTLSPGDEWIFADDGTVQGVFQTAPPYWIKTPIPGEKMLLFRTSVAKNNPEGRPILRAMYIPWYYSKNLAEIEAIAAERMGAGVPVVYLGDDTVKEGTDSDLEFAKKMVRDIRSDEQSGIVIPYPKMGSAGEGRGMLFELMSPPGRGIVDFEALINRYDQRIAMTALAQFIMLGQNAVGSFALSKDQSDLFIMALGTWAEVISQVVNRHAVPKLLELNPSLQYTEMPKLDHSEIAVADLNSIAQFINAMVGAQVIIPDRNLEADLRAKAKLPPAQPQVAPQIPGMQQPPPQTPGDQEVQQAIAQVEQALGFQNGKSPGDQAVEGAIGVLSQTPGFSQNSASLPKALELLSQAMEHKLAERFHLPGEHDQQRHAGEDGGGGDFNEEEGEGASSSAKAEAQKVKWYVKIPHVGRDSPLELKAQAAQMVVKHLGESDEKVRIGGKGYRFEVQGVEMRAAAHYNPATRDVVLFDGAFDNRWDLIEVIAHETSHRRFDGMFDHWEAGNALERHYASKSEDLQEYKKYFRLSGEVRPEALDLVTDARERYALKSRMVFDKYLSYPGMQELMSEDGITEYSKHYWRRFNATREVKDFYTAVNETLAECETKRIYDGKFSKSMGPAKVWQDFSNDLRKFHNEYKREMRAKSKGAK